MMPSILAWTAALLLAAGSTSSAADPATRSDDVFSREQVIAVMRKVNDYQRTHPWKEIDRNWIRATYYTGVMALYRTTSDPKILRQAIDWAEQGGWAEGDERDSANKMTCGQTYLELYFLEKRPERIARMKEYLDGEITRNEPARKIWYYCDTLYVGPPTLAMMGKATGEAKYYRYLDKMYWEVTENLFDKQHGLFYRDRSYVGAASRNGKKVFWSRGNGWVIAGIPRVLTYLPEDVPSRQRYVDLLKTMAHSIARVQGPDGLWRSNLADPDECPNPETSGSAFFLLRHGVGY